MYRRHLHVCGLVGRTHMGDAAWAYVFKYEHASSICIFCASILNRRPYKAANVSILTCMHDCNFADEVCVWVMSTLLWTCPHNCGHVDGLNVVSISCYFMLQIPNLGVCECIWCSCVMMLHTPHMYFRLQSVLSANLCSVGFANVDVFLSKCVLQKCPLITRFLQL